MQVVITDSSSDNGTRSFELATEKHQAYVSFGPLGVGVLVKPFTSRLFGSPRYFATVQEAIAAYKLPAAKAMIETAAQV